MNDLITTGDKSGMDSTSLNPFPRSKIYVGVGNTIVSMAFFGVGPSIVAYGILKVLEEDEKTSKVIPFSHPATLPLTALMLNQVFNMPVIGALALGALYAGVQYIRNNNFPSQASIAFSK